MTGRTEGGRRTAGVNQILHGGDHVDGIHHTELSTAVTVRLQVMEATELGIKLPDCPEEELLLVSGEGGVVDVLLDLGAERVQPLKLVMAGREHGDEMLLELGEHPQDGLLREEGP